LKTESSGICANAMER